MDVSRLRDGIAWIAVMCLWTLLPTPPPAFAEPLDLEDQTPRWIEVRFEVSPADQPGSLDRDWSVSRRAHFEPGAQDGVYEIRIPADEVEAQLRSTGTDTIDGTFSEFVWRLDRETGHVVDAELTGRVRESIRLGPFRTSAQVEITVDMDTRADAGFEPGHGILGIPTNRFCSPNRGAKRRKAPCVAVRPVVFDRARGYVNAVGTVRAASGVAEIRAFSPLGEVQFIERSGPATDTVVSGPIPSDAVCSAAFNGPCRLDLGGES